jgi:urea carboxylase
MQRRSQKVVEEAPAPDLPDQVRDRIRSSAVQLAKDCGYRGAGTVEFLFDAEAGEAAFIEMNTRLQVEHPVTELITGVDLVRLQLRVAAGHPLGLTQNDITFTGHSVEVRINAEDPDNNFMPSPGVIEKVDWPGGPGVRVDAGFADGCAVVPYYDSMIAKLVTWDATREQALARMRRALQECRIEGVKTTLPLLADPVFAAVDHHTKFIEQRGEIDQPGPPASEPAGDTEPAADDTSSATNELAPVDTERSEHGLRYTWGGDEFLFVEVDEAMGLRVNFTVMSIARRLVDDTPEGISDVCPANASLLIRFDPDVLAPADLEAHVRSIETQVADDDHPVLSTRIIEVPVWYDDPFTGEVGARFRKNHQTPDQTDLDFAAQENGLADKAEFIARHHSSPWLVTMVGFVAGLPFMFQIVPPQEQLEVPKYLSPRTDTPKLTVGHGGCFACVYSVRGAGGYQMFGVAAAPIYDPAQRLADFADFMVFFKPGDIVKFTPVSQDAYKRIVEEVEAGTFVYRQAPVEFDLAQVLEDPHAYNATIVAALQAVPGVTADDRQGQDTDGEIS